MITTITVREFARLTTGNLKGSLDAAAITQQDFSWLCQVNSSFKASGAPLLQIEGQQWLRLDNYVGVLEMPSGTHLEILPKHHDSSTTVEKSRALLCRMIHAALNLPTRHAGVASLALFDAPLSEWVIQQFLAELEVLIMRGLRFDYVRMGEEQRYLRGELDTARQMRQPPTRQHYFHTRHDLFSPDRPENRLLRTALTVAAQCTAHPGNWKLAHELLSVCAEIPMSRHVKQDFLAWRQDRLMAHYISIQPWCELLLGEQMPLAVQGLWRGMSMLFPMEKLFERYVEASLRPLLSLDVRLTSQASSRFLCRHLEHGFFKLCPDMLLSGQSEQLIVDAKWKRLSGDRGSNNYGLSQPDFYQLFAYGHQYLNGKGNLILVFPKTSEFSEPLPPFHFSTELHLWAIPFDLESAEFVEPTWGLLPLRGSARKIGAREQIQPSAQDVLFESI